jgi:hypothetical protein
MAPSQNQKGDKITQAYDRLDKCTKKECPAEHKRAWAKGTNKDMQQLQAAMDACRRVKCKKDKALADRLLKKASL